jgi:hypothetical protein
MLLLMLECIILKLITIRFGFHKGFEEFDFFFKINLWKPRKTMNIYIYIYMQIANFHKIWKQLSI